MPSKAAAYLSQLSAASRENPIYLTHPLQNSQNFMNLEAHSSLSALSELTLMKPCYGKGDLEHLHNVLRSCTCLVFLFGHMQTEEMSLGNWRTNNVEPTSTLLIGPLGELLQNKIDVLSFLQPRSSCLYRHLLLPISSA